MDAIDKEKVILSFITRPQIEKGDKIYFGQKDSSNRMHGKGILYVSKDNYLYYGHFKADMKHGFGKEFYSE